MASRTSTPLTHPERDELDLFQVMSALVDPIRRGIVVQLAASTDPTPCTDFPLPVTKAAGTRHFRILREAGIIHQHDVGVRRMNRLRHEDLDARFPGLLELVLHEASPVSRSGALT